jgi:hypothetical protein
VDAYDEHVLVVRAVEDADLALARNLLVDPPQVVVRELLRCRHLERGDNAALRVERLHHLLDGAVLARRVDALEHDQHRSLGLCPEAILKIGQARQLPRRLDLCIVLVPPVLVRRIDRRQVDLGSRFDAQLIAQTAQSAHVSRLITDSVLD